MRAQLCLTPSLPHRLYAALWAPPSMGLPRQEYWSGLPFPSPGDLPHPGWGRVRKTLSGLKGRNPEGDPEGGGEATGWLRCRCGRGEPLRPELSCSVFWSKCCISQAVQPGVTVLPSLGLCVKICKIRCRIVVLKIDQESECVCACMFV